VTRRMGYEWRLRLRMAEKGLFQTSDLVPLLAERGVCLSREQVYRLVTSPPQRMSMDTLAALCDILQVTPNDLIEIREVAGRARRVAGEGRQDDDGPGGGPARPTARSTTIRRPQGS